MTKQKPLKRTEAYLAILKKINMKPAAKSKLTLAYFTTDHLRALDGALNAIKSRPASRI
jgi:hypothetical protein